MSTTINFQPNHYAPAGTSMKLDINVGDFSSSDIPFVTLEIQAEFGAERFCAKLFSQSQDLARFTRAAAAFNAVMSEAEAAAPLAAAAE